MDKVHKGSRENAVCADCGFQFKTQNQLKYFRLTAAFKSSC